MEIQAPSCIAQATAPFQGLTHSQIQDSIKRIFPYPQQNLVNDHNHFRAALSSTGASTDYQEADKKEAHRLLQGVITNPWHSIHDITVGKADPQYYDSGMSEIQDIQAKTIGHFTGAPQLNDPRTTFTQNLLKMKVHQKEMDNDYTYDYMKDLFLTQVEKGSTYYQAQAMKQQADMEKRTAEQMENIQPLDMSTVISSVNLADLENSHKRVKRDIVVRSQPHFSHHIGRAKLDELQRFAIGKAKVLTPQEFQDDEPVYRDPNPHMTAAIDRLNAFLANVPSQRGGAPSMSGNIVDHTTPQSTPHSRSTGRHVDSLTPRSLLFGAASPNDPMSGYIATMKASPPPGTPTRARSLSPVARVQKKETKTKGFVFVDDNPALSPSIRKFLQNQDGLGRGKRPKKPPSRYTPT